MVNIKPERVSIHFKFSVIFILISLTFGAFACGQSQGGGDDLEPGGLEAAALEEIERPPFHFTVTSDIQGYQSTSFSNVCLAINDLVDGPGEFHVTVGDITYGSADDIDATRHAIDEYFGSDAIWFPVIGNHDVSGTVLEWMRNEFDNGNGLRRPLSSHVDLTQEGGPDGPLGAQHLNYSFDHNNAHFIVLDGYWDGGTEEGEGQSTTGSDTATDGDIVPELYTWLEQDLDRNQRPFVFVFIHEPAFPETRHVGDSLDKYLGNRDNFWALLEDYQAAAVICGHIHYYYKRQGDAENSGEVWQVVSGAAGYDMGDGLTFLDIVVGPEEAVIYAYRNKETGVFTMMDSIVIPAPR